jgi:uncharacterized metal-binding protein YceD (DUF177 family)
MSRSGWLWQTLASLGKLGLLFYWIKINSLSRILRMNEAFKIYVEQLRDGHAEAIVEKLGPEFLDIHEKELSFVDPVVVEGEAYLAENDLVLHFDIQTFATLPCVICNEAVKTPIKLENFYHTVPAEEIKSGIYNFQEMLRENILLTAPFFAECNNGQCPHRGELNKFFRDSDSPDGNSEDEGYRPFAHL